MNFKDLFDRVSARLGFEPEHLIEGMAKVSPNVTSIPVWIQIRQRPDSKHKEPSIKVRLNDAKFKERAGNSIVSIRTGKVIKGDALANSTLKQVNKVLDRARPELLAYWEGDLDDTAAVIEAMRAS